MWESSKVFNGKRRVNYFIKDVYGDPTNPMYFDVY